MRIRRAAFWAVDVAQVVLVALLGIGIAREWFPLGVVGEWVWSRVPARPAALDLAVSGVVAAAYIAFCVAVLRRWRRRVPTRMSQSIALAVLVVAAVLVQVAIQSAAPYGYGLTKWVTLAMPGAGGYHEVAVRQVEDLGRFWREYPTWIQEQGSLHLGTHPPGLILSAATVYQTLRARPEWTNRVIRRAPESVTRGLDEILGSLPAAERAAITLTGLFTLLACAATVAPLYALARASLSPSGAWVAACVWPLVPAAVLFQPTADTAYPVLATSAVALALRSWRAGIRGMAFAVASGTAFALGMQYTLAFLAVGLVAFLTILSRPVAGANSRHEEGSWRAAIRALALIAASFLAATAVVWWVSSANPFAIWWWNQANHARFYVDYPRSYFAWLLVNPVELAVAIGLPLTLWGPIGLLRQGGMASVSWAALLTVLLLTISGRNLSEIARLWLPLMPFLLVAVGNAFEKVPASALRFGMTLTVLAVQTLLLQSLIQVVYPV